MLLASFSDIPSGLSTTGFYNKGSALVLETQLLMHPLWKQSMKQSSELRMR